MRINLASIYSIFFLLGLFFMPFNSWEGIEELGEFKKESAALFFLVGSIVVMVEMLYRKKIVIPKSSIVIPFALFLIWCILTILLNYGSIGEYYFKKTTGLNRFIRQYFALILSSLVFSMLYFYALKRYTVKELLVKIRFVLTVCFIVVFVYGFLEVCYIYFGIGQAKLILYWFDYFPFTEFDSQTGRRISSVTWESPALATYLISISAWMFSYMLTHKTFVKYLPTLGVLFLTYFSGSRTALIVVLLLFVVFLLLHLKFADLKKLTVVAASIILILGAFFYSSNSEKIIIDLNKKIESLDFKGNLKKNISNQSRFGIQHANMQVFKDNPIIGVGFGQQGFVARDYYPTWAKKNNYEFKVMYDNKNYASFPPGYNLYVRLLAETGLIGFSLFIIFLFALFRKSFLLFKEKSKDVKYIGIIVFVSLFGYTLNFMQLDTFRIYGFWISVVILLLLSNIKQNDYAITNG